MLLPLFALTTSLLAAEPPTRPLGLTVSGGVSLGTWESGFIYFFTEAQKQRPTGQLRVVTGASAGSANALLAAISSCQPSNPLPMSSLGWQVWGPIGFRELFDQKRANSASLFVRDELERSFERVRESWLKGLPETCDVVFGASVTRVKPREVKLKEGLTVPRVAETFLIRIQGRGEGKPPRLSNYVDPSSPLPMPLLPFVNDENDTEAATRNFGQLRSVLYASSAFPLAFAPVKIGFCLSKPAQNSIACDAPEFVEYFVDGGVFDNAPLRLAWSVADSHLRTDAWCDVMDLKGDARKDTEFLYLDPDTTNFPVERDASSKAPATEGVLSKLLSVGGGLIDSARARELGQLAREQPDVSERLQLALGGLPKASAPLNAFTGFFDIEFRRFDFYLGMYDAFVQARSTAAEGSEPFDFDSVTRISPAVAAEWAPFLCMLSMMEPAYARYLKTCEAPELIDFRIVLQTSIDRLYDTCRPDERNLSPGIGHQRCREARAGEAAPFVPLVTKLTADQKKRRANEALYDYQLRLLGEYEFRFTDLGLPRAESKDGSLALRHQLDGVVDVWAAAQETLAERVMARTAARTALNLIHFSPATVSGYAVLGTLLEGGFSLAPFRWKPRWLQLTGSLALTSISSVFTDPQPRFAASLTSGPEVHLSLLSTPVFQPRIAVRGGVQLGVLDGLGTKPCATPDPRGCTQPELDVVLTLGLFERLRIELIWQTYPLLYATRHSSSNVHVGVGLQFY